MTIPENSKIIAIDFDGTIVEDRYPGIGRIRTFAFESMKKFQEDGHRLILWTYRSGNYLQEAVEFCKKNGISFYAVNKNFPEEEFDANTPRKINADIFIDDRNVGGFVGWGKIYQIISKQEISQLQAKAKPTLLNRLFKK
ncbi:MAG: hypothetical protein R2831_02655 [Chitinophagaceae bacterium]